MKAFDKQTNFSFYENDRLNENKNILKDNDDYLWKQNKQPHKGKYRPLRSFEKV